MNPPEQSMGLFAHRRWYCCFVMFLAFLIPVSPLLAEIQQNAASSGTTQATASATQALMPRIQVSPTSIALDLFGQRNYLVLDSPLPIRGADTKACDKGRSDANLETEGTLWFIMGFVLTIFGPILAYLLTPTVPESHLKGKSASYASSYSDCYQQAAKAIHVKWAWYGLGTVFLAAILAGLILWLSNTKMSN